ncbi:MAG: hypothetical protein LRY48_05625 [Bacteroides graminisolvens]|nr:hypothetical protein [Bacteroides graminisolvens]
MKQDLESLSPFELSLYLENRMGSQDVRKEWLNAGQGNPNWTAPIPREAYFLLGEFAVKETIISEKRKPGHYDQRRRRTNGAIRNLPE